MGPWAPTEEDSLGEKHNAAYNHATMRSVCPKSHVCLSGIAEGDYDLLESFVNGCRRSGLVCCTATTPLSANKSSASSSSVGSLCQQTQSGGPSSHVDAPAPVKTRWTLGSYQVQRAQCTPCTQLRHKHIQLSPTFGLHQCKYQAVVAGININPISSLKGISAHCRGPVNLRQ